MKGSDGVRTPPVFCPITQVLHGYVAGCHAYPQEVRVQAAPLPQPGRITHQVVQRLRCRT
jgi:hypothetical protein